MDGLLVAALVALLANSKKNTSAAQPTNQRFFEIEPPGWPRMSIAVGEPMPIGRKEPPMGEQPSEVPGQAPGYGCARFVPSLAMIIDPCIMDATRRGLPGALPIPYDAMIATKQ